jgi:hypothetical protein
MEQVRTAVRSFCPDASSTVSNAQLYEALGVAGDEAGSAALRSRLNQMVRARELVRVQPGLYRYNWQYQPDRGVFYGRIWRAVRIQKPGWDLSRIAQLTRASYAMVRAYCVWLAEEGYVAQQGKDGNTRLYRTTQKAVKTPQTPYPPIRTDPFEKEKAAAASLVRAMLCRDLYSASTRRAVLDACALIQERFGSAEPENGEEDA